MLLLASPALNWSSFWRPKNRSTAQTTSNKASSLVFSRETGYCSTGNTRKHSSAFRILPQGCLRRPFPRRHCLHDGRRRLSTRTLCGTRPRHGLGKEPNLTSFWLTPNQCNIGARSSQCSASAIATYTHSDGLVYQCGCGRLTLDHATHVVFRQRKKKSKNLPKKIMQDTLDSPLGNARKNGNKKVSKVEKMQNFWSR